MSTKTLIASPVIAPPTLEARPVEFANIPRSCWDRLLAATPAATPFARWTFQRAWWDAYGETAHDQYLVCVPPGGAVIDFDSALAIVPLMHRHEVEPGDLAERTVVRQHSPTGHAVADDAKAVFFGASYHADYATVLANPNDSAAVARAVAAALDGPPDASHGARAWDVVDLRRMRPIDPALSALEAAFQANTRFHVVREREDVCPVITATSPDWEAYLASLDKKARHEIRRKLRRAAEVGELALDIGAPTHAALEQFIDLHSARFGEAGLFPDSVGGQRSRAFVHRLAELERAELDGGQLLLGIVRCAERPVFAALAFDDGTTSYLYNAGMDPSAAEVSPGVTGTALFIRDRLAAGRSRIDFLRGNEPYKYEWGAVDEPIERLLVTRR